MERAKDQGPQNPVDRPLVTFDTNIIYALRNNEPDALPIRQLLAFNHAGVITINVTLSTALEEQRPDEQMEMHEYAAWLQEQGIPLAACRRERNRSHASRCARAGVVYGTDTSTRKERGHRQTRDGDGGPMTCKEAPARALRPG